ncbi:MAG: hypothetical protein ACLQU1_23150 [Bryobacteraceae bacterium]
MQRADGQTFRFQVDAIGDTGSIIAIVARSAPEEVLVGGKPPGPSQYDFARGTCARSFPNPVEPEAAEVTFKK